MMRDWMADQGLFWGPLTTTVLFVLLFVAVIFWIYRPGSREAYRRSAQMPLDGGAEDAPPEGTNYPKAPQAGPK